jgi:hypothetical protein
MPVRRGKCHHTDIEDGLSHALPDGLGSPPHRRHASDAATDLEISLTAAPPSEAHLGDAATGHHPDRIPPGRVEVRQSVLTEWGSAQAGVGTPGEHLDPR